MQDIEGESVPCLRYCYAIPIEYLPVEVLCNDKKLCRLGRDDGMCFARVLRQTSWNMFQVVVAADPHHLYDDQRSHLINVPASALPAEARVTHLSARAIPEMLLSEDQELRLLASEYGKCSALVECQLSWDMYRVRVASITDHLCNKERSHAMYLSQAEMQAYVAVVPEQEVATLVAVAVSSSISAEQKPFDITALEPILVSEEELKQAAGTVHIPQEIAPGITQSHGSKLWRCLRRFTELVLYRALLHALEQKKDLQEIVRRVLVFRRQFKRRLISIRYAYEIDHYTYWSIQVYVPTSLI